MRKKAVVKRNSLARLAAVGCVCVVSVNNPWLLDISIHYYSLHQAGFLATRVLPRVIGRSILRTSVKPRCIPLSDSQDPELVLLSLNIFYPKRNRSLVLRHFNFEKSNSLDSGKGWSALYHPPGEWCPLISHGCWISASITTASTRQAF